MSWSLDGIVLESVTDIRMTATSLSFTANVARRTAERLRDFDQTGNAELQVASGGGFRTLPRGDQVVSVSPPAELSPPIADPVDGVVTEFSEEQLATDRLSVGVTVQRLEPRPQLVAPIEEVERVDAVRESDLEFVYLATAQSELQLDHVGLTDRSGDPADGALSLTAILSDTQAAAIADDARFASAVVGRAVPDAGDTLRDTTDGAHTVRLNAPPEAPVDAGAYALREWEITSHAPGERVRWELSATVTRTEPIAAEQPDTLVVEDGETETVGAGERAEHFRAVVRDGGSLVVDEDGTLDLFRGLRVLDGDTLTVPAHTERTLNKLDVRDGGAVVVEPDATLRIISPIDNRS